MNKKIVFTGHVDHGKSTLCGHILYKAGYVDEHQMSELRKKAENNKKKGWEYAYVLERGKTMDFNPIEFTYQNKSYTFIDTPGHKSLIRTLINGLNHYNTTNMVGCLLVSVLENEFVGGITNGQTKEDILLLRATGIDNMVVLINKMDLVKWDLDIFEKRKKVIDSYIKKLGFKRCEYLPISAYDGTGINEFFPLIDSFDFNNKAGTENIEPQICSQIVCQLKILHDDTFDKILSAGFEGILHVRNTEYQVVIDGFKHFDPKTNQIIKSGKSACIIKNNDVVLAKISPIVTDDGKKIEFNVGIKDRVILRKDDWTIAFGRVSKLN
jgi:small GTP-binding protein